MCCVLFVFNDTATTEIYTLSLHDALPIYFIKNYTLPTATVNKSLAFYMDESGGDMDETAKNFLQNNNMWEKWVPSDVKDKVKAAL